MLIGHSAGAHLCALTTLFLVDEREELFMEACKQRHVAKAIRGVIGEDRRVGPHRLRRIEISSELRPLVIEEPARHCELQCSLHLECFPPLSTGLSGVYNIMDHYEHEQKRAVEYVSTMHKAMNGVKNFPYYSPTQALKQLSQDKLDRYVEEAVVLAL